MRVVVPERGVQVRGRVGALERALGHVVRKAVEAAEATEGSPQVGIEAGVEGRVVVIRVSDNGSGVALGDRERVFEPFFSTEPPDRGVGLGFFVAHKVAVRGRRGRVDLACQADGGTVVMVILIVVGALGVAKALSKRDG